MPVNIQFPMPSYTLITMRYFILLLALVPLLFGCSVPPSTAHSGSVQTVDQQKDIAELLAASQFSVNVQLSEGAREKLNHSKETIIVAGDFTGHPKEGTEARYLDIKSEEETFDNLCK